MVKVRLYGQKNLRTAAYNRSAARFFLGLAEEQKDGQFYSAQASIVFSAFTHEAFLNTLGPRIAKDWPKHEYNNVGDKLNLICKTIEYKPNKGKRPYQTLKKLFRFRNLIAHGREETIRVEGKIVPKKDKGGYLDAIEGEWEQYCTVNNAHKAYDDVLDIATDLCDKDRFGTPDVVYLKYGGDANVNNIARGYKAKWGTGLENDPITAKVLGSINKRSSSTSRPGMVQAEPGTASSGTQTDFQRTVTKTNKPSLSLEKKGVLEFRNSLVSHLEALQAVYFRLKTVTFNNWFEPNNLEKCHILLQMVILDNLLVKNRLAVGESTTPELSIKGPERILRRHVFSICVPPAFCLLTRADRFGKSQEVRGE